MGWHGASVSLQSAMLELESQLRAMAVHNVRERRLMPGMCLSLNTPSWKGAERPLSSTVAYSIIISPTPAARPALYVGEMLFGRGVVGVCKVRTHGGHDKAVLERQPLNVKGAEQKRILAGHCLPALFRDGGLYPALVPGGCLIDDACKFP